MERRSFETTRTERGKNNGQARSVNENRQHACDTLNQTLFGEQLPPCLITLQRVNRTHGYVEAAKPAQLSVGPSALDESPPPLYRQQACLHWVWSVLVSVAGVGGRL